MLDGHVEELLSIYQGAYFNIKGKEQKWYLL